MGDFIFNEIVTFELTKDELTSVYKPARRRANRNYALSVIAFAILAVVTYVLELPILPWVMIGMLGLSSIVYLCTRIKINRDLKKQLKLLDVKRYNYALYEDELVVTVKDDRSPFNEYIVPLDNVNATVYNDVWTFSYRGRIYALPTRVLRERSRYYKYAR